MDTAKLRELAQKATPGPWHPNNVPGQWSLAQVVRGEDDSYITRVNHGLKNWRDNLEYIAAANPQTILALLDEIKSLSTITDRDCDVSAWAKEMYADPQTDDRTKEICGLAIGAWHDVEHANWLQSEIMRLMCEIERYRADAERYRHIRSCFRIGIHGEWVALVDEPHGMLDPAVFDAKIDEARADRSDTP